MPEPPLSNPYRAPTLGNDAVSDGEELYNEQVLATLQGTRPWVLFLGILGLVGTGLMLMGGLFVMGAGAFASGSGQGASVVGMGVLYFLFSLIYIAPSIFLIRYAKKIREFVSAPSAQHLESALSAQKSFWKFVGVIMLMILVFYVTIFVAAILAGVASMVNR